MFSDHNCECIWCVDENVPVACQSHPWTRCAMSHSVWPWHSWPLALTQYVCTSRSRNTQGSITSNIGSLSPYQWILFWHTIASSFILPQCFCRYMTDMFRNYYQTWALYNTWCTFRDCSLCSIALPVFCTCSLASHAHWWLLLDVPIFIGIIYLLSHMTLTLRSKACAFKAWFSLSA